LNLGVEEKGNESKGKEEKGRYKGGKIILKSYEMY